MLNKDIELQIKLAIKDSNLIPLAKCIVGSFLKVKDIDYPHALWLGLPYGQIIAGKRCLLSGIFTSELVGVMIIKAETDIEELIRIVDSLPKISEELDEYLGTGKVMFEWMLRE